ncbi:MAG: leucine-rich repeat domain-containing protein, partial [Prevotella sp.]|nr:leucine-rich repeat domain-containing protein [Prevotella sp.]
MKKIYLLLVLLLMTVAKINATEPTIVQYKSSNRCYINIYEALTSEQVATLKAEINSKGYTSVDFGTKNGYALTLTDLQKIFGTNNGLLQTPNDIKVLSLKDVTLTEEAADQYGQQIGYLPALEELTTPKSCKGPNMNSPSPEHKTIKKLIIPKLGANDTSDKAQATVGTWKDYTALESIDLNTSISPSGITAGAFYGCYNLKTVKIMSTNITTIGAEAFRDCVRLEKITLPYGLLTIEHDAFYNCFLKNINLPQTVQTIEANAFRGNPFVRTIKIPASVQTIGELAFGEMPELDNVYVFGENTKAAANAFDKDVIGERFTYTRSTLTERQQVQNATLEEANHTGWTREGYQKVTSVSISNDGKVTITRGDAPRNPAQLHILNTETAKKNYLNPFLRFLNGGYQVGDSLWTVEKLINVYKFVAEHKGEKSSDGNAGWSALKPYNPSNATDNLSTSGLCDDVLTTIRSYDENNDGSITKAEVANKTWTDANLTNYDFDAPKDDIITKESFKTQYWDATLQSYDTDNDGSITKTDEGNKKWTTTPLSNLAKDDNNDITKESLGRALLVTGGDLESYATYLEVDNEEGDNEITKAELGASTWNAFGSLVTNNVIEQELIDAADWDAISGYDTNDDKVITEQEVLDKVWADATALTPYDTDNNGTVTRTEINDKAWADATNATNGSLKDYSAYTDDGKLTKSEVEDKTWNDF